MTDTQQPEQDLDRIERSIQIDATVETVFALVSRPGWWINHGTVDADPKITYEDDVAVVVDEQWGKFRIQSLQSRPPAYVSFRWLDREDPSVGTTVEFWVSEPTPGQDGVTLRVVESGFTQLGNAPEQVEGHVRENTDGWETELEAARRFVTGDGA